MRARPAMRARRLSHWLDPRHPHPERFVEQRARIESVLASQEDEGALQRRLIASGSSLRCVAREIPPVFGSFFPARKCRSPAECA